MSLYKLKAKFTKTDLVYQATADPNTIRYNSLSNTVTGKNAGQILDLNGTLSSTAKGSGFATPQIVAITSAGNDGTANVKFKVEGTTDGSTAASPQTISAVNGGTAYTTTPLKTVTKITVMDQNTTGAVSAGIASLLESSSYSAAQAATYTIKATEIPTGIDPLKVEISFAEGTAVFDYGETFQATSREFMVDDDKISTLTSGSTQNGNLTLVGGSTISFSSPHHVTITGATDESAVWFQIKGATAASATDTEWVQGKDSAGAVVSTKAFKTVTSIKVVTADNGNTAGTSAGKLKAGVTDENKEYTVTVFASQESQIETTPHSGFISHSITQNGSVSSTYLNEISDQSIAIQDVKLPLTSSSSVSMQKNNSYTFQVSDFGYSDPDNRSLSKIKITNLEANGDLTLNGDSNHVSLNQVISVSDISGLKFTPATDAEGSGYGNFEFKVHNGLDYSSSSEKMKVHVGNSVTTTINYFKGKPGDNTTFKVNNGISNYQNYNIDGSLDPTLTLYKSYNYIFEMTGNGHPFYLKNKSATSGINDQFTDGVTREGTIASTGSTLKITVPSNAPSELWYQCSAHSGMLGKLEIKSPYQVIKNMPITIKDGSNQVYSGSYETNNSGIVDFVGVQNKTYDMSFSVSKLVAKSAINIEDVSEALDISAGTNTSPSQQQQVAADINSDGKINIEDVAEILDISSGTSTSSTAKGVFRDSTKTNPFDGLNQQGIQIQGGNSLTLDAYILGDVDGSYSTILGS